MLRNAAHAVILRALQRSSSRAFHRSAALGSAGSTRNPFGEESPLGPELKRMQEQLLANPELLAPAGLGVGKQQLLAGLKPQFGHNKAERYAKSAQITEAA